MKSRLHLRVSALGLLSFSAKLFNAANNIKTVNERCYGQKVVITLSWNSICKKM